MKHISHLLFALLISNSALAQNIDPNQFYTPLNTGSNMTLGFDTDDLDDFVGGSIGAFNSEGTCIGQEVIQDEFFTMALWGNDSGTSELDGLLDNEMPTFAILTEPNGIVVSISNMIIGNYSGYVTQGLVVSTGLSLSGCTNSEYVEFHTQGYTADIDNGSCETQTHDLDITSSMFTTANNTGSNMNIGMNTPIINLFEGGTIGAFIEGTCVGLAIIQDQFFTMALWGDDTSTDEIDGLQDNEIPTFAILTTSGYVLAFESVPEFGGYITNDLQLFTEINFDLTIYGCMDPAYCNFNPEAEEDDGSCEGMPGCIDDHYVQFDENASCELEGACIQTWQSAYEINGNILLQAIDQYDELVIENQTLQNEFDQLIIEKNELSDALDYYIGEYQTLQDDLNLVFNQIDSLQEELDNYSSPIQIDIVAGWNIIGFTLDEAQDAVLSFDSIVNYIEIVKNNTADVYWPDYGFNGIGDLIPGQGYQIKTTAAIDNFMYPDTNGQRIELSPTVPQWVIDMPTELHPNDIRSLVKIVNLLGQEVELNENLKGSTLIYLYNDGTVEKKIH